MQQQLVEEADTFLLTARVSILRINYLQLQHKLPSGCFVFFVSLSPPFFLSPFFGF